jgi:hypothetical protein
VAAFVERRAPEATRSFGCEQPPTPARDPNPDASHRMSKVAAPDL